MFRQRICQIAADYKDADDSDFINRLRKVWKDTEFIVRGDARFCCRELMDRNEDQFVSAPKFIGWAYNRIQ